MNQESQRSRNFHISSSGFQIRAEFGARLNMAFFLVTAATRTAARKNSLFDGGWSLRGPIGPFFNFLRYRTHLAHVWLLFGALVPLFLSVVVLRLNG